MRGCISLKRVKRLSTPPRLAIGLLAVHGLKETAELRLTGWVFLSAGIRNPRLVTRSTSKACCKVTVSGHGSGWPTRFLADRRPISRSIANSRLFLLRPTDQCSISFLAELFRMMMLWSLRAQWPQWIQPALLVLFATCRDTLWSLFNEIIPNVVFIRL